MKYLNRFSQKAKNDMVFDKVSRLLFRPATVIACGVILAACDSPVPSEGVSEADPDLYFVRGYRSAADDCKLTGETEFTINFLDDAADLVTCSTGSADAATLVAETSARMITQTNSYTLYSVPRR